MPSYDDDRGVSAILINTKKGLSFSKSLDLSLQESDYSAICKYNSALTHSVKMPIEKRTQFYSLDYSIDRRIDMLCKASLKIKSRMMVVNFLTYMGIDAIIRKFLYKLKQ